MSDLIQCRLYIPLFKSRKENDDFIVRFEGQDEYYIVNETGKLILDFLNGNGKCLAELDTYLESEFTDFSDASHYEIEKFIDSLISLSIIVIE